MLDDLRWVLRFTPKWIRNPLGLEDPKSLENEITDLRVDFRRAALNVFFSSLIAPIALKIIVDIFYSHQAEVWIWGYWYAYLTFSLVLYLIAFYMTRRIRRAKTAYLLRAIFHSIMLVVAFVFFILLGIKAIPLRHLGWFFLIQMPAVTFIPIIYQKRIPKFEKLFRPNRTIYSITTNNPIWSREIKAAVDKESIKVFSGCIIYIAVIYTLISLGIFRMMMFAIDLFWQFFQYFELSLISATLLFTISYIGVNTYIIYKQISELEALIEHPILLPEEIREFYK